MKKVTAFILTIAIFVGMYFLISHNKYVVLNDEQIAEMMESNTDLNETQQTLVDSALKLRGKVHYFWGGKSGAHGFDDAWGKPRTVESKGSESTGTVRPYGLDCSGFVSWCYVQLGYTLGEVNEMFGLGTWSQWEKSSEISFSDLRVGDVVFKNSYPTSNGNHIGICVGFYNGNPVFAHCSSSADTVIVSNAGDTFRFARRPDFLNQVF